jgi:hypothetical protein
VLCSFFFKLKAIWGISNEQSNTDGYPVGRVMYTHTSKREGSGEQRRHKEFS